MIAPVDGFSSKASPPVPDDFHKNPIDALLHRLVAHEKRDDHGRLPDDVVGKPAQAGATSLAQFLHGVQSSLHHDVSQIETELRHEQNEIERAHLSDARSELMGLHTQVAGHLADLQSLAKEGRHAQAASAQGILAQHASVFGAVKRYIGNRSDGRHQPPTPEAQEARALHLRHSQWRGVELMAEQTQKDATQFTAALEDFALAAKFARSDISQKAYAKELHQLVKQHMQVQGVTDSASVEFEYMRREARIQQGMGQLHADPASAGQLFMQMVGTPANQLLDDCYTLYTRQGEGELCAVGREGKIHHRGSNGRNIMSAALAVAKSTDPATALPKPVGNPFDAVIKAQKDGHDPLEQADVMGPAQLARKTALVSQCLLHCMPQQVVQVQPVLEMLQVMASAASGKDRTPLALRAEQVLNNSQTALAGFNAIAEKMYSIAHEQCGLIGPHAERLREDAGLAVHSPRHGEHAHAFGLMDSFAGLYHKAASALGLSIDNSIQRG